MFDTFEVVYSILLFVAIYFQVFFLDLFFQQKKSLEISKIRPDQIYPSVSFLIPCWNEEKTVVNTINSILAVDYPKEKLEIYVVDDGSTDKTWEKMSHFKDHPQVKMLQKENGGKHTALNLALDHVKTDLVVSFDADTKIDPSALKKAVHYFLEDKELMALAGTMIIDEPKTLAQKAQNIEYQTFSFTKKMLGSIGGVWAAPGAFSVFRREVFEKIGKYRKAHNLEDVELTIRLQEARLKVGHCHTAFAYTKGPDSLKKLFRQRLRWCYGGINNLKDYRYMIFNKKYGHFGFLTLPMNIFNYILVIFVFSLGLYRIGLFINQKILELSVFGWKNIFVFDWDSFFISLKPTFFLAIIAGVFILSAIYFGKKISLTKKWEVTHILYFIVIYGLLAPLWIIKSLYKTLFFKTLSWR